MNFYDPFNVGDIYISKRKVALLHCLQNKGSVIHLQYKKKNKFVEKTKQIIKCTSATSKQNLHLLTDANIKISVRESAEK